MSGPRHVLGDLDEVWHTETCTHTHTHTHTHLNMHTHTPCGTTCKEYDAAELLVEEEVVEGPWETE
jgi:hypothetical protein